MIEDMESSGEIAKYIYIIASVIRSQNTSPTAINWRVKPSFNLQWTTCINDKRAAAGIESAISSRKSNALTTIRHRATISTKCF